MNTLFSLVATVTMLLAGIAVADTPNPSPQDGDYNLIQLLKNELDTTEQFSAGCCKICRKGKACGNSCISRSYSCHQGAGCACDG